MKPLTSKICMKTVAVAAMAVSLLSAGLAQASLGISFTTPSDEYQDAGATGNILGWSFTANQDLYATRLAVYDSDRDVSPEPSHFLGLWDSSGALLASATIYEATNNRVGFYHWADISSTLLQAGHTYYVGAVMGSDYYTAYMPESLGYGFGAPTPFGELTVNPYITFQSDAFYYLANGENPNGIVFGSASLGNGINDPNTVIGSLGANIDITPTPIPAAVYLLGSGLIGMAGIRRRDR